MPLIGVHSIDVALIGVLLIGVPLIGVHLKGVPLRRAYIIGDQSPSLLAFELL